MTTDDPNPRQLLALLANQHARTVIAHLFLGETLGSALAVIPAGKRAKTRVAIVEAGLVNAEGNDARTLESVGVLDPPVFSKLLAANAPAARTGIDRFVEDGTLREYPANQADRREVLTWVADQVLPRTENVSFTEQELNERLEPIHPDVAVLRRYLVDAGLVVRTADGTAYARAESGDS